MTEYFFAAIPEERLYNQVLGAKSHILRSFGDQVYLKDPPHLTLYVFKATKTPAPDDFVTNKIKINLLGWQLFGEDKVTRKSTIGFAVEKTQLLEEIQIKCVKSVRNLRLGIPTRYKDVVFAGVEKENLREYGFPYLGKNWIAHLTLCSINSKYVEKVKEGIDITPFCGEHYLNKLCLFKLVDESPVLVWEVILE